MDDRSLDELRDDIEDEFCGLGELWSEDLFMYAEDVDELDGYDDWWAESC